MKNNKFVAFIIYISLLANLSSVSAASSAKNTTPQPYTEDEFPSWLKDLRRAEIITLGAMPFITFNTSLCYSLGNYALHNFDSDYFINPFSQSSSSSSYSTDEQIGILITSLGISFGIGVTDFIVHSVKRSNARKRLKLLRNGNIKIESVAEDPDAIRIPLPHEELHGHSDGAADIDNHLPEVSGDGIDAERNDVIIELDSGDDTSKKTKKAKKLYSSKKNGQTSEKTEN